MVLDNGYANRIEGLFYSKSDEKFTVRALLDEIFGDRSFGATLDVGPGLGHITEPLARRSKHLTLVERMPQFEELLKRQFENAQVIIEGIDEAALDERFDIILASHVLYYQPENNWVSLTKKLHSMLNPGGEMLVILNSDGGDWWKIVHTFWDELRSNIGFNYIPVSQFKKELSSLGRVQAVPYRYQVWIEPGQTWCDFIGKQLLELQNEELLAKYQKRFAELASNFKQVDGSVVLDFRSEIIRIPAAESAR